MRTPPLNIKNLKALIASDSFKNLPESSQNAYRIMLSRKEARHAKRMAERAAEKENQNKVLSEIMKNIHVGDVFSSSWGYEQTNVNFFQVVELIGKTSVRIKEVCPPIIEDNPTGAMSTDRVYAMPNRGEMLPVKSYSVFIEDNSKGAVKRIQTYNKNDPIIKLTSFAYAHPCKGKTEKCYVSWYA